MSPRALLCFFSVAYVGEAAPFTDLRYPPAPGSGGKECTINAECGLPAANCNSLRTVRIKQTQGYFSISSTLSRLEGWGGRQVTEHLRVYVGA